MRIQTRLFLGTALLVLALMAVQWWLHQRQLRAIESELGAVAASVGKDLLTHHVAVITDVEGEVRQTGRTKIWVTAREDAETLVPVEEVVTDETSEVHVLALPDGTPARVERRLQRRRPGIDGGSAVEAEEHMVAVEVDDDAACDIEAVDAPVAEPDDGTIELRVARLGSPSEPVLLVRDSGGERRIPIPVSPTQQIVRETLHKGLVVSGGLLLCGLVGSAVLANRLTRPLRQLAEGSEAVARGALGTQVDEGAAGEVGELQRAFNRMSLRLRELELEREAWRRREHLAQLGDLSRGLAHAVRNPLNTLGLAVEELAGGQPDDGGLAETARHQIRRIDRWLRSFLSLAAGGQAAVVSADLGALAREVALEAIQEGAAVKLTASEQTLPVSAVPAALRSALANLIVNATEASPGGATVEVRVFPDGPHGVVAIEDRGPGLPDEVREKLYAPHVTTKIGGSGMGLFLARQLIVGMHGGSLMVSDRDGGGTRAEVRMLLTGRNRNDRPDA